LSVLFAIGSQKPRKVEITFPINDPYESPSKSPLKSNDLAPRRASDSPTAGMATNAAPPAAKPAPAQVRPIGWGPVDRVTVEIFALKKTIGKWRF
jgi:hypothetical protein